MAEPTRLLSMPIENAHVTCRADFTSAVFAVLVTDDALGGLMLRGYAFADKAAAIAYYEALPDFRAWNVRNDNARDCVRTTDFAYTDGFNDGSSGAADTNELGFDRAHVAYFGGTLVNGPGGHVDGELVTAAAGGHPYYSSQLRRAGHGKRVLEVKVDMRSGANNVGIGLVHPSLWGASANLHTFNFVYAFRSDGSKHLSGSNVAFGRALVDGDKVMLGWDTDTGKLYLAITTAGVTTDYGEMTALGSYVDIDRSYGLYVQSDAFDTARFIISDAADIVPPIAWGVGFKKWLS